MLQQRIAPAPQRTEHDLLMLLARTHTAHTAHTQARAPWTLAWPPSQLWASLTRPATWPWPLAVGVQLLPCQLRSDLVPTRRTRARQVRQPCALAQLAQPPPHQRPGAAQGPGAASSRTQQRILAPHTDHTHTHTPHTHPHAPTPRSFRAFIVTAMAKIGTHYSKAGSEVLAERAAVRASKLGPDYLAERAAARANKLGPDYLAERAAARSNLAARGILEPLAQSVASTRSEVSKRKEHALRDFLAALQLYSADEFKQLCVEMENIAKGASSSSSSAESASGGGGMTE